MNSTNQRFSRPSARSRAFRAGLTAARARLRRGRRSNRPPASSRSTGPARPQLRFRTRRPPRLFIPQRTARVAQLAAPVAQATVMGRMPSSLGDSQLFTATDLISAPKTASAGPANVCLMDSILLNPFLIPGTRTALVQQAYSKFKYLRMKLTWRSAVATSVTGDVILHYQPDPRMPPFHDSVASLTSIMSSRHAVMGPLWGVHELEIPIAKSFKDNLFASVHGTDLRQFSQGRLDIYQTPSSSTNATAGFVVADYALTMAEAILSIADLTVPTAPLNIGYNSTIGVLASANWTNEQTTLPALLLDVASNGTILVGDLLRITFFSTNFPANLAGGTGALQNDSVMYCRVNTLTNGAEANGDNNYLYRHPESAVGTFAFNALGSNIYAPSTALTCTAANAGVFLTAAKIEVLQMFSDS
jgi:hypothetical protein